MKLLRLKITDPKGFRSLPCGFEHHFRTEWSLQDELAQANDFAPFVCAGLNGSGKSNLLEALAAIFFQLEVLRVRRSFLPEALQDEVPDVSPVAFELDYLIRVPAEYRSPDSPPWAKVGVWKKAGESVRFLWDNQGDFSTDVSEAFKGGHADILLPQYVLGYSSGENEILSLPFFKMRFVQFDEYWNALTRQLSYPGHPETRLAYLDSGFSQAILLCNLLFQDESTLQPFREDVGIDALREFRIILRRRIPIEAVQLEAFDPADEDQKRERRNRIQAEARTRGLSESEISQSVDDWVRREIIKGNPALSETDELGSTRYRLNLLQLLEGDEKSSLVVSALKRCATLNYVDDATDTLVLDYWVNEATRQAFRENFDGSALALFQAFQVLLTLNLYAVSDVLKTDLYTSTSHYVSETVPTLASDQRIMRFKFVRFTKQGVAEPMMLKELSDGEHQLLHSLGLCLLFRETNSLFLLDEPETHFNPDWRANFISRLRQCLTGQGEFAQEMLITTHTPFLISDSKPDKVLVFAKDKASGKVSISHPPYNTLGASINKITHETFGKRETIGGGAQQVLEQLLADPISKADPHGLARRIMDTMGDSVERTLAVHALLQTPGADKEPG
ncbi:MULTISPECIES: restriction system-associated AAA family ATPase [Burkholderia cepacia complex]|uniref:ABC transporter n=1 Tax=Burkholderia stagnalis TaxID=1503054 RepID=A0ABX9YEJ5_9BURK|nr:MULTISPECIES: restriction system-associated AAA family ATPase [Burkholderia cepacia complex]AYZ67210.1 restriction system-associated AAA family ATPase [Burkholderia multivorans]RQQ44818.1 ABC transporter [Burkholderia stagnalis]RQQ57757.1 ABC transporter [Burkholderia stagnalis]RQQ58069.1 ABC transporter [Burkholderia stagnalis]RQQ70933.1 ABC transporter [Burkholderia stagnalis]